MNENHVALRIFGFGSLSGLSQRLQLAPTETAEKGEVLLVVPGNLRRKYECSYWAYQWTRTEDRVISELIDEFVATVIVRKRAVLKEVVSSCSVELSIIQYYVSGCNPGLPLSSNVLSILGEVGMEVDVYCMAEGM